LSVEHGRINHAEKKEILMNKITIVTGGASRIGKAVVERFARDNVVAKILRKDETGGNQAAASLKQRGKPADFIHLDVTRETDVQTSKNIIANYSRLDVNAAGGSLHRHETEEFPLDHWQAVIDANLTSTFLCCRAVITAMKTQKSGTIINISSDIAFSGSENRAACSAAKAGILGLSKTLAPELAPFNVRVNTVAPGRIATQRVRATYSDEEWNAAKPTHPSRTCGRAEGRRRNRGLSRQRCQPPHDRPNASCQRREDYVVIAIAFGDREDCRVLGQNMTPHSCTDRFNVRQESSNK
jgi:3-oxoacyl-[acyl-carrier protein] reductase